MAVRRGGFAGTTTVKPVSSWSYSRYGDYVKCPAYFKFKNIEKLGNPENEAMRRGTALHKFAELQLLGMKAEFKHFVTDRGPICTKEEFDKFAKEFKKILGGFKTEFADLKKLKPACELSLCFTKDWERETVWNDWAGCWVRIKVDAVAKDLDENLLQIVDHKTGKINDAHRGQLSLYAIAGFLHDPTVQTVRGELWYLDQAEIVDETYTRKQLPQLMKDWGKKVLPLLNDTTYKPTPGRSCTWCDFSKAKKGPCQF